VSEEISADVTSSPSSVEVEGDSRLASRLRINVSWLLKLRWAAVAGQLVTILVVSVGLGIELPLAALLTIVLIAAMSNALMELAVLRLARRGRWKVWAARGELLPGSIMVLDVFLLTAMLYVSGGPSNPFSIFYLANISLAGMILRPRWLLVVCASVIVCYAGLFVDHQPLEALGGVEPGSFAIGATGERPEIRLLVQGKFVAFAAAVAISMYFMTRVTSELSQRRADLRQARHQRVQTEKIEALATLAAGAAHELASPLSTIAVVARELELHLETGDHLEDAVEDSKLIRREVDRCRYILDQMSHDAGAPKGEELVRVSIAEVVEESLARIRSRDRVELSIDSVASQVELLTAKTAIVRGIRSLLRNAIDATPQGEYVALSVTPDRNGVKITIVDHGEGMSPEVLARVGDPFFTTKEPGKGMGLGLFITRAVVHRLGGSLTFESVLGQGTTACVYLPKTHDPEPRED